MLLANGRAKIDLMFAALIVLAVLTVALHWAVDRGAKALLARTADSGAAPPDDRPGPPGAILATCPRVIPCRPCSPGPRPAATARGRSGRSCNPPRRPRRRARQRSTPMTDSLTIRRPDDWHLHLRDGAMLEGVWRQRRPYRPRHRHAEPRAARRDRGRRRAYRDRIRAALPAGSRFEPLMTLYLTEETDPEDVAAAAASGPDRGGQALPRGRDHQFRLRRARLRPRRAGARAHGRDRPAALRPWRGDRPGGRHLRPRGGVPRAGAGAAARPGAGAARGARACDHRRGRRLCPRDAADRGHHHHASPRDQPQPHPRGRHPAALLLPAGRQARDAPPRAGRGGDLGRGASSPAPTARRMPTPPRRAPAAAPAASPRPSRCRCSRMSSRRPARSTGWRASCRSTARPSTAARRTPTGCAGAPDAAWSPAGEVETGAGPVTVFDPGFPLHWQLEADHDLPDRPRDRRARRRRGCCSRSRRCISGPTRPTR